MMRSVNKFGLVAFIVLLLSGAAFFFLKKELPKLYINEFMANNTACCPDGTASNPEFDDWIEIYNAGDIAVNLGGMYFSQNKKKPLKHLVPQSNPALTTIPPGGYLLIWADGDASQGILHLNFKLDQDGEFLGLYNKDGRKIDSYKFGKQLPNVSFGREKDGAASWKDFSKPTPGATNN